MKKTLLSAAVALSMATIAQAAPVSVNLSGWQVEDANGAGAPSWTVQGANNDSVFQSRNSRPSIFFNPGTNAQGTALAGTIRVETTSDDDYIGFVLGYNSGEARGTNADFWLIDWKKASQAFAGGTGDIGLALSHVSGNTLAAGEVDFWNHIGTVSEVQRGSNLGSTGWVSNQQYAFELTFTKDLIEVFVDGVKELSYSSADFGNTFTDGGFGFYNYSQQSVRYAGITEEVLPPPSAVPVPAALPLLLSGFAAFGVMKRRRKSA